MSNEEKCDALMDKLDDWLVEGRFDECDAFLWNVKTLRYSNAELLAMLTATAPAKSKLPRRRHLYNRTHTRLLLRGASAETLLKGLI